MKTFILSQQQLEQATVQIHALESGTGFFITKQLILTARHVLGTDEKLAENLSVTVIFQQEPIVATLLADDYDDDIALLTLETPVSVQPLPLSADTPAYYERWKTYGFPNPAAKSAYGDEGVDIQGIVNQTDRDDVHDIKLTPESPVLMDYAGLSGGALVIDKQVCGIILYQKRPYLYAISFAKINGFLAKNGIRLHEIVYKTNFIPNEPVFDHLKSCILEQRNGFLLMAGSPGSGKTSIVNHFKPDDSSNLVICGTYFIKDPNNEIPPAARSSRENLLDWIETVASNQKPAKEVISVEKRIEKIGSYLQALSDKHRREEKIGVLLIDGLDDLVGSVDTFLSVLPSRAFPNLVIVFSCTDKTILPANIAAHIDEPKIIRVEPLDLDDCVVYILEVLDITQKQAKVLAEQSEGHPLYLHYLIEYVKTQIGVGNLGDWMYSIPKIHGDIRVYYEQVWSKIKNDVHKRWIALTIAQLRQPVFESDLKAMLDETVRHQFHIHFPKLVYLLKNELVISIYHNSFQDFLNEKVKDDIQTVHNNIADYCKGAMDDLYSIGNRVFHFTHSSKPAQAIDACTQTWADTCALHDIDPDLVLYDIRQTQGVCIDLKQTVELIRVKLLLQRIGFRYNQVFRENAYELAEALIVAKRVDAALKYLLRDNKLLVDGIAIPYLIQKLTHHHNISDAKKLYEAGRTHITELIVKEFKSQTSSSLENWNILFDCLLFLWETDREKANRDYSHYKSILKQMASHHIQNKPIIDNFRYQISARQASYLLWRYDWYVTIDHLKASHKDLNLEMDQNTTKSIAQRLIYYKNYVTIIEDSPKSPKHLPQLIRDLEYMIDHYGYYQDDIKIIIIALIRDSERFDLVEQLIKDGSYDVGDLSLRKKDGVKVNLDGIHRYFEARTYMSYVDTSNKFPIIPTLRPNVLEWEAFFKAIIHKLGSLTGKAYRLKAENRLSEGAKLVFEVHQIVQKLDFSLKMRVRFERSYALPEAILPILYDKITRFYIAFAPDSIPPFIQNIAKRMVDQLGIYTEGTRKSLFNMAEALSEHELHRKNTFDILKILEQHIDIAVQNRWERTSDFIKLLRLYGKIKATGKLKTVYQQILATSMGPSWYKDAHLGLINTVLNHSRSNQAHLTDFQPFAGLLDAASGEMTFKRYVRNAQNDFVGSLAKAGHLNQAIAYFQFQLMPSAVQILQNAESSTVDAPSKGEGSIYGANEINETAAMKGLITALPDANPYIQWAFCEIFITNDDAWQYLNEFGALQARILNQLWQMKSPFWDEVSSFIPNTMRSVQEDAQAVENYQDALAKHLDPHLWTKLKVKYPFLKRKKVQKRDSSSDNAIDLTIQNAILAIEEELEFENKESAQQIMVDLLKKLRLEKKDLLWYDYWSHHSTKVTQLLKKICDSDSELLILLKSDLIEHYSEEWRVSDKLIELLEGKLDASQIDALLSVVKTHFDDMVHPDKQAIQKYDWLAQPSKMIDTDKQLLQFLIWFLNHSYKPRRNNAMEMLRWLGCLEVTAVIELLFEACFESKPLSSGDLSAFVLAAISDIKPNLIWNCIKDNFVLQSQIIHCQHFMMKYHFRKLLKNIGSLHIQAADLLKQFEDTIPDSIRLTGDVELQDACLTPIKGYIEAFNQKSLLNGAFCKQLLSTVEQYSKPLTPLAQWRADTYLKRSFNEEPFVFGQYDALLRHAFNVCISKRVTKANFEWANVILTNYSI